MKTISTFLAVFTIHCSLFTIHSYAQVLCIKCYNQNARILTDTNNLIMNGSFENTNCIAWAQSGSGSFCPNSSTYNCNFTDWTCTGGGLSTYACLCDTTNTWAMTVDGIRAVYFGSSFCNVCPSLDTSCIINTGCEVTDIPSGYPSNTAVYGGTTGLSLAQTVNGLTVGNNYTLEFWTGGENSGTFLDKGVFALDVGFGNVFLRDPGTEIAIGIGTRYVVIFTADSTSHTIKFTNWGHICSSCTELILDDVRLFATNNGEGDPCATAANDLAHNSFATVFPNPATNIVTIITSTNDPSQITLCDVASRKLMQQKFIGSTTLNIETLAKGIYLYEVRNENGVVKQGKVVKE